MVLGIRERTGRSVTPKTDKTSVKTYKLTRVTFFFSLALAFFYSAEINLNLLRLVEQESRLYVGKNGSIIPAKPSDERAARADF
jgi:hypothetical protein